jgi:hypothetical protein
MSDGSWARIDIWGLGLRFISFDLAFVDLAQADNVALLAVDVWSVDPI